MQTKRNGKIIPRISQNEVYPLVGEAGEKLKALVPVFGEEIIKALVTAVKGGKVRKGELELNNLSEPAQKLKVSFENKDGDKDIKISLSGDWKKIENASMDNPIISKVKGIVYRKRAPTDEKPIAEEGELIAPNGPICAISQSKNNIWYLQLPSDKFPKGGILTKFLVADGKEVDKDGTICYIKKVE